MINAGLDLVNRLLKLSVIALLAATTFNAHGAENTQLNPTEAEFAHLLYSNDELLANADRHLIFKAWSKFKGRYIVASYVDALDPTGTISDVLPVEIAIVQYTDAKPTIISRNKFSFKSCFVSDKFEIDTANYQIGDSVTAFGLRTFDHFGGSGFEQDYDSLDLYIFQSDGIDHIAGNLSCGDGGMFGSSDEYNYCNNLNMCEPVWSRYTAKRKLIVRSSRTNGYFDLLEKTTTTEDSGRLDDKSLKAHRLSAKVSTQLFRWNGQLYEAKPE